MKNAAGTDAFFFFDPICSIFLMVHCTLKAF